LCLGALALALAGCRGGALAVTGTVTRGGNPLPAGTIAFEPEPGTGTTGPGASARVQDGKFEIARDKNLVPGHYVVRVGPEPLGSGADLKTAPPQFKPWETKVELRPGGGPLRFDVPVP
jgi:hypothetical protein